MRFSAALDPDSLHRGGIRVTGSAGESILGDLAFLRGADGGVDRSVVVFQPACPTLPDSSGGGLEPGGQRYTLQIQAGTGIQSALGAAPLAAGLTVPFVSAKGSALSELYFDMLPGAPAVRLRGGAGVPTDAMAATYLEVGGDPQNRVYFEFDGAGENARGALPAGYTAPLHLYSAPESRIAVMLFLDQPVAPGEENINGEHFGLERRAGDGEWEPLLTQVHLESNCAGAVVRMEPTGTLPAGAELRVVLRPGLTDLVGEAVEEVDDRAGRFWTTSQLGGLPLVDEVLERFTAGTGTPGSLEDPDGVAGVPSADWGGGKLQATFDFDGTGGPGGNFDLVLIPGEQLFLNTTFAQVVGGPDGNPTTVQDVIGGVLDVDDLVVPVGAEIVFLGPNPATILVAGQASIAGEISVRGSNNNGVGALNTANLPEVGAAGNAAGGMGGTGSFFTTQSTPMGGMGFGAFNVAGGGGEGGEAGYGLPIEDDRRGAGGGGGRLGPDVFYDHDANPATPMAFTQTLIGLDIEPGSGGTATGLGAVSQSLRPQGGQPGAGPFVDGTDANDHLGTLADPSGALIEGEASAVLAGAGGGAGGDAVQSATFPLIPFLNTGDEKGAGGGGGAGGLSILALGPILLQDSGSITADGGHGGGGENTFDSARVGGGSGGGSGGHIVLASLAYIEVQGEAMGAGDGYRDDPDALEHFPRPLSALGGQGGEGRRAQFSGSGGASASGQTRWRRDGIPVERMDLDPSLGGPVPPLDLAYMNFFPDFADPDGPAIAAGGDGGPGLVQLHVEDPAQDLRFTNPNVGGVYGVPGGADVTRAAAPPPVGWAGVDGQASTLLPFFGRFSAAKSRWIYLGGASAQSQDVRFLFRGVDPATGLALTNGDTVIDLPPVLGPTPVGGGTGDVRILPGGLSLVFGAADLVPALRSNPGLMAGYDVLLESVSNPGVSASYEVQVATVDAPETRATFFVAPSGLDLDDFVSQSGPLVNASIIPRWFRVETGGQEGVLPPGASIRFAFDATRSDAMNRPDEMQSYSSQNGDAFTSDISLLSGQPWSWVRFRVEFDQGGGTPPLGQSLPALDLLRIPFELR